MGSTINKDKNTQYYVNHNDNDNPDDDDDIENLLDKMFHKLSDILLMPIKDSAKYADPICINRINNNDPRTYEDAINNRPLDDYRKEYKMWTGTSLANLSYAIIYGREEHKEHFKNLYEDYKKWYHENK